MLDAMLAVAARDASIARVLREIAGLEGSARRAALALVAVHLGPRVAPDLRACLEALGEDAVAARLREELGEERAPGRA